MTFDRLSKDLLAAVDLGSVQFTGEERVVFAAGALRASVFRYPTGVDAVRLSDGRDELVILPFQGQHVWSARLGGRDVTMRNMFDMPRPTQNFFETYGGFYQHCGATAIGAPEPHERRQQHGELPNAPYRDAVVGLGEDAAGRYLAVTGRYNHTVAFACNYEAIPVARLHSGQARASISITITNLKRTPMEVHYLGHLNWRAVDGGRLEGTLRDDPASLRVRREIPPHILPGPGYVEWIARLAEDPTLAFELGPDVLCDPEIVFAFDPLTDADGLSHFLQIHPDGTADHVSFKAAETGAGTRWICRTPDKDAIGIAFPVRSTTTPGKVNDLPVILEPLGPGESFSTTVQAAVLGEAETAAMREKIRAVKG